MHTRTLLLLPLLALPVAACGDKTGGKVDSGGPEKPYCYDMADADSYEVLEGGGDPGSGQIEARLITDDGPSEDLHDPQIVGQMNYTLENLDVGGSPQAGKTEQDGTFREEVGAGNWRISISGTKVGLDCQNRVDIVVEDGNTTRVCVDTLCE